MIALLVTAALMVLYSGLVKRAISSITRMTTSVRTFTLLLKDSLKADADSKDVWCLHHCDKLNTELDRGELPGLCWASTVARPDLG